MHTLAGICYVNTLILVVFLHHETTIHVALCSLTWLFLQVCLGLCIRGGILKQSTHIAFLYFMFALTVAGIAAVHIIMVRLL